MNSLEAPDSRRRSVVGVTQRPNCLLDSINTTFISMVDSMFFDLSNYSQVSSIFLFSIRDREWSRPIPEKRFALVPSLDKWTLSSVLRALLYSMTWLLGLLRKKMEVGRCGGRRQQSFQGFYRSLPWTSDAKTTTIARGQRCEPAKTIHNSRESTV